ncbi:MAG: hypothetical protein R3F60_28215 [bacterium]
MKRTLVSLLVSTLAAGPGLAQPQAPIQQLLNVDNNVNDFRVQRRGLR